MLEGRLIPYLVCLSGWMEGGIRYSRDWAWGLQVSSTADGSRKNDIKSVLIPEQMDSDLILWDFN